MDNTTLPTCCHHCVIEGMTSWPKEAIPASCARHKALEVSCSACNGTGNDSACPACVGCGTIIADTTLWGAELLAIDYRADATKHGDDWLSYLLLITAERRKWDLEEWIEAHRGITMMLGAGAPWQGATFAIRAEETIIDSIALSMRSEAYAALPVLAIA